MLWIFIIKPLRGFYFFGLFIFYNHLTSTRSVYFDLKITKKNRRRRLIIVEKTYPPTNKKSS